MRDLHVGRELTWPAAIASQAVGLLGMRGSGKSNLARVVAEELFASKIPFVVFDPIGNWFGIRAGRDGKPGGGLAIPIFGGEHGDLPLDRTAGAKIADLILERRLSCVLDLSHPDLSETDKRRFLVEFGERLFRKKSRESGWLELILEEADDYAPQTTRGSGAGSTAECLGTFQRIVKRGRFKGLGVLMVTQRSAAINKDLLYMVGTLVVFRTTGPRDQDAVAGWVKHNALNAELLASLPTLADGEAWVIAPESLGTISRAKFRRMATYDTGSTPEHGGAQAATLADIDVPALSKEFAAAAEKAKAEDPRELRRTVAELRAQLDKARAAKPAPAAAAGKAPKRVEVQVLKDAQVKRLEAAIAHVAAHAERTLERIREQLGGVANREGEVLRIAQELKAALAAARIGGADARTQLTRPGIATGAGRAERAIQAPHAADRPAPVVSRAPIAARSTPRANADGERSPAETKMGRAMLTCLAQRSKPLQKRQILILTGYRSSGPVSTMFAALGREGLVAESAGQRLQITDHGLSALGPVDPLPVGRELREHLLATEPRMDAAMLKVLFDVYPEAIGKGEILERTGYKSSGPVSTAFGRLVAVGYATATGASQLRAADELFEDAA